MDKSERVDLKVTFSINDLQNGLQRRQLDKVVAFLKAFESGREVTLTLLNFVAVNKDNY